MTLSSTSIAYTFYFQGIQQQPIAGYIHQGNRFTAGPPLISFGWATSNSFSGPVASGSITTTQANLDQIRANPSGFYVSFLTGDYPGGALRGELAPYASSYTYFPTVAKARGLNNSNFVTDLSILNRTTESATAILDFFASSATGLTAPTASRTVEVAPGEQLVIKDLLASQFQTSGDGALRVSAPRNVTVTARVFNDQRAVGEGTTGLLVPGSDISDVAAHGVLPLLSNASAAESASGIGYRTNIGYFNPYGGPASVTFRAIRTSDGTELGAVTRTIPGFSRVQLPVFDLISTVAESDRRQDDFYLSFTASKGSALFVYAAVVDNKTGDGIYIKAAASPAGSDPAPATPAILSGSWSGGGHGFTLIWELSQQGELVTGNYAVDDGKIDGRGFLSGTISGSTINLNGFGLAGDNVLQSRPGCVDTPAFSGTLDGSSIQGRFYETGSCGSGAGAFALTKQ